MHAGHGHGLTVIVPMLSIVLHSLSSSSVPHRIAPLASTPSTVFVYFALCSARWSAVHGHSQIPGYLVTPSLQASSSWSSALYGVPFFCKERDYAIGGYASLMLWYPRSFPRVVRLSSMFISRCFLSPISECYYCTFTYITYKLVIGTGRHSDLNCVHFFIQTFLPLRYRHAWRSFYN